MELDCNLKAVFTPQDLIDQFPFGELRGHQKWVLEEASKALSDPTKKFIVIQAPTGSGKSPLAVAQGRALGRSYLLTMNKFLQDQYTRDFGHFMADLKGRTNYFCSKRPQAAKGKKDVEPECCPADASARKRRGCNAPEYKDKCEYFQAIHNAVESKFTLMNFSAGLCFMNYTDKFGPRPVLIIDEAHALEDQLTSFIEFSVTAESLLEAGLLRNFDQIPNFDAPQDYVPWLRVIMKESEDFLNGVKPYPRDLDELKNLVGKISTLISVIEDDPTNFVLQKDFTSIGKLQSIKINPIIVSEFAHDYLFKFGQKVILMSATIVDFKAFAKTLGIKESEAAFIDVPSTFPKENRPIHILTTKKLSQANLNSSLPSIIKDIQDILDKHENDKGIIHVSSYALAQSIYDGLSRAHRTRVNFPKNSGEQADVATLQRIEKRPTVILSPSMTEGVDLKDDMSRFQIIVKMPFASLGDALIKARMQRDSRSYGLKTAIRLIQAYGRSIRSETDYAETYVIDGKILDLLSDFKTVLPKWFLEAIAVKGIRMEQ